MKIYGIPNCNTVKKALDWLKLNNVEYEFHDFKKLGITESKLKDWAQEVGWESLVNKRGTTWRNLDPAIQQSVTDQNTALKVMAEKPSVIKRPVMESSKGILVGFDPEQYEQALK